MGRPYSMDLRRRCVAAVDAGQSCRVVAERFGVGVSTVVRWAQRHRQTGDVEPARMGGRRPVVLEPHRAFIAAELQRTPHLNMRQLRDLLAEHGVMVSRDTVWRFVRKQGLSFKKNAARP